MGFSGKPPSFVQLVDEWSRTLSDAVETEDSEERGKALEKWRSFPGSMQMHPQYGAEHFMPLLVAAGAGGEGKAKSWVDKCLGMGYWSFWWD